MLVLVTAYPWRAVKLIKYLQIINKAEAKFKGLAWLHYNEQFHRCASQDLTLNWGLVDLELWTVTFLGQAKPYCFLCSSPYCSQADCPIADPAQRPARSLSSTCYNFNKPSGCFCQFQHVCSRCHSPSIPSCAANLDNLRPRPSSPATVARSKVFQRSSSQQSSVSTPINIDVVEHELLPHPDIP